MFKLTSVVLASCLVFPSALRAEETTLTGVVTDPGTPARFQVDGFAVNCIAHKTLLQRREDGRTVGQYQCPQHFIGEVLTVTGASEGRDKRTLYASGITPAVVSDTRVSGFALIDKVERRSETALVIRADGFLLDLAPATKISYDDTLTQGLLSINTNQWIQYRGLLHPDGTVAVEAAFVEPNIISDREAKLHKQEEFDPAAVTRKDGQNKVDRFFSGVDRMHIPAYDDPALQARVNAIGAKLIPAYQRELPQDDPSKINFRFQLVSDDKYAYFTLSNGIILLSHGAVELMDDEAQLASLLATAIADVLQKQELRAVPAKRLTTATTIVGTAGMLIPGVGLAAAVTNHSVQATLEHRILQQNSRESLCLLHDAGYDLREAPLALWKLAQKKGKPLQEAPLTDHTRYEYALLGTVWKSTLTPGNQLDAAKPVDSTGPPGGR